MKQKLFLEIEGATELELRRGIAAAEALFAAAGVKPWDAAYAAWKREGEHESMTDEECDMARLWDDAQRVAVEACCRTWPARPETYDFGLEEALKRKDELLEAMKHVDISTLDLKDLEKPEDEF